MTIEDDIELFKKALVTFFPFNGIDSRVASQLTEKMEEFGLVFMEVTAPGSNDEEEYGAYVYHLTPYGETFLDQVF